MTAASKRQRLGDLIGRLETALATSRGVLGETERRALLHGASTHRLEAFAARVRDRAWEIDDAEVAGLTAASSDDTVFEVSVCSAYAAARLRYDRGLDVIAAVEAEATSAERAKDQRGTGT